MSRSYKQNYTNSFRHNRKSCEKTHVDGTTKKKITGLLIEHYEKVDTKDKGKRPEPSNCRFLTFQKNDFFFFFFFFRKVVVKKKRGNLFFCGVKPRLDKL